MFKKEYYVQTVERTYIVKDGENWQDMAHFLLDFTPVRSIFVTSQYFQGMQRIY
jgi:hypothetical protein